MITIRHSSGYATHTNKEIVMKRTALLTAALMIVATSASALTIKNSKHDMSSTSGASMHGTTTTEICVFCHTPHNPAQNVPLWNRTNPAATGWSMYNSPTISATASAKLSTGNFDADSISLFCMSCHDGVTTIGAMHNVPTTGSEPLTAIAGAANIGSTGKILTDDHPVGFDYNTAATEDTGLRTKANALTSLGGNAFFGAAGNNIECSSCHKVHDNANAPFLRISNSGSALCLACHNK